MTEQEQIEERARELANQCNNNGMFSWNAMSKEDRRSFTIEATSDCKWFAEHPIANKAEIEESMRLGINKYLESSGFSIGKVYDSTSREFYLCDRDGDEIPIESLEELMNTYMTPDESPITLDETRGEGEDSGAIKQAI